MISEIIKMYQNDKPLFLTWGIGSATGGYSGIRPPDFINSITVGQLDVTTNLIHLGWAVITAIVATTVSFMITKLLKKIFKTKS